MRFLSILKNAAALAIAGAGCFQVASAAQQSTATMPPARVAAQQSAESAKTWRNLANERLDAMRAQKARTDAALNDLKHRIEKVSQLTPAAGLEVFLAGLQRARLRSLDEKGRLALAISGASPLQAYRLRSAMEQIDAVSGPLAGQVLDIRELTTRLEKLEAARKQWLDSMRVLAQRLEEMSKLQERTMGEWATLARDEDKRYQSALEAERQEAAEAERQRKEELERQRLEMERQKKQDQPRDPAKTDTAKSAGPPVSVSRPPQPKADSHADARGPTDPKAGVCSFSANWRLVAGHSDGSAQEFILTFTGSTTPWSTGTLAHGNLRGGVYVTVNPALEFTGACSRGKVDLTFQPKTAKRRLKLEVRSDGLHVTEARGDSNWDSFPQVGQVFTPKW